MAPLSVVAALSVAWLSPAAITSASATTPNPAPGAGARNGATRLPFAISDATQLLVDVGTGNALLNDRLVTLPGINNDQPISLSYNSTLATSSLPSAVDGSSSGSGWTITGFDQKLIVNADNSITYEGPQGLSGVFVPVTGSTTGAYTSPTAFRADLVKKTDGTYTLTDHVSQTVLAFSSAGHLRTATDRNSNKTTFGYGSTSPYGPAYILSTRGGPFTSGSPTASIDYTGGHISSITETKGSDTRTLTFGYNTNGQLTSVIDATGKTTGFGYGGGSGSTFLTTVTSPGGATTTLTYDGTGRATQVSQTNTATGSPGTSTTRLTYPSGTQTLVADPDTDQGQAVSAVPHTTYTLYSTDLVKTAVDPDGHSRGADYTSFGDAKSQTNTAGGTTTFAHDTNVNGGESLTGVTAPGGAGDTIGYTTPAPNQYLPSSTTDDATNTLNYTYDGVGNQQTTAQGTGPQAKVTYTSPQGQPLTSQSPGAGATVKTTYTYDNTGSTPTYNLQSITPATGGSLASRAYTWDGFGRLKTATDGRSHTLTYTDDGLDRVTKVDYSDAPTADVTTTYTNNGWLKKRIDGSGTTTWTWDDLGHLLTVANTAGGGTESYTYDKAGYLATKTDTLGTTTYSYDDAHLLTAINYPQGSRTLNTRFSYDSYGRRTNVYLQANADSSTWAAHEQTQYDNSGRVTRVIGQNGPASSPTTVLDQTACYNTGAGTSSCSTTGADRHKLQWVKNNLTGEVTTYGYDANNRLHTATVTAGSNPRTYTYTYDAAGNRTGSTVTGTSPTSQTLTYNNANQISTYGYTYDGSGNQTAKPGTTATFNTAGQQTSTTTGGTTTTYTYAGTNSDELLSEATPGGHTYSYVYGTTDPNGLPEIEQVGYDTNTAYITHDPTTGTPLMIQTAAGTTCLYMNDVTANPVLLSTSYAATSIIEQYDPYGANTETNVSGGSGAAQNPFLFHYGIQDRVTGTVKFGARWYDPTTGTWTQQDTLNAPLDPGNANRYLYAGGDPVNNADPSGLGFWNDLAGDLVAAAGVAVAIVGIATSNPALAYAGVGLAVAGFYYSQNAVNCDEGDGIACGD